MHVLQKSFMERAIALAQKSKGKTAPNPCVGAVLVQNDSIVAEGYHQGAGSPHAEIVCIEDAHSKGVDLSQCTLYVTLEPCSHYGKTPPCTNAILEAGIPHLVYGLADPNPEAAGGGKYLAQQGVTVSENFCSEECADLLDDFIVWQKTDLPYTYLKLASTLDGKIATRSGHSQWVSDSSSLEEVHELRSKVQAIIVGGNTFYVDDPQLTCRLHGKVSNTDSLAVVVSSRLPNADAQHFLLQKRPEQTIFWTTVASAASPKAEALRKLGVTVLGLSSLQQGSHRAQGLRAELSLYEGLKYLRTERSCYYTLCEGGGRLALSMLEENLIHEIHLYMAPKILGDTEAISLFHGRNILNMDQALQLRFLSARVGSKDAHLILKPKTAI